MTATTNLSSYLKHCITRSGTYQKLSRKSINFRIKILTFAQKFAIL